MMTEPFTLIADLDGTFGLKTPTYPDITVDNGKFFRHIASLQNSGIIIATGRPRTQARIGLMRGGILPRELYEVFSGGVFEDGLFVEDANGMVHNALDEATPEFLRLRNAFYTDVAKQFFLNHKYLLVTDSIVKETQLPADRISYELLDYLERPTGKNLETKVNVLYLQGNDVRATLKAPIGYMDDELKRQAPLFRDLEPLVRKFMQQYYPNPEEYATLVRWEDAVEIYPVLGEETFRKGVGVEMLLERTDPSREATLIVCCDSRNDISLVKYVREHHNDFWVLAPNNASNELKESIRELNKTEEKGFVLPEDCTRFGKGVYRFLGIKGFVRQEDD